jgi:hypothetical protein
MAKLLVRALTPVIVVDLSFFLDRRLRRVAAIQVLVTAGRRSDEAEEANRL